VHMLDRHTNLGLEQMQPWEANHKQAMRIQATLFNKMRLAIPREGTNRILSQPSRTQRPCIQARKQWEVTSHQLLDILHKGLQASRSNLGRWTYLRSLL